MALPQGGVQKGHFLVQKINPDGRHVMDERFLTSPYAGPFEIKKSAPLRTHIKNIYIYIIMIFYLKIII